MADPLRSLFQALFNRNVNTRVRDRDDGPAINAEATPEPEEERSPYAPLSTSLLGQEREMTALTSWSTAMVRSNIAQLTNVMLGVALLGMTWMHWNTKPTVIIKPPVLTGEIRIEDGLPNKEWQESWALFLSHMLGNINPRNVDFVTRTTISMLSPKLQVSKEADIRRMVEMMKMSNLTQSFDVQDLQYEPRSRIVWVWGYKTTQLATARAASSTELSNNSNTADRRRWTFEYVIRLSEVGMPVVTHIDQYEGLPKFDRANGVTEEGDVLSPPEKKGKKSQKESSKEQN